MFEALHGEALPLVLRLVEQHDVERITLQLGAHTGLVDDAARQSIGSFEIRGREQRERHHALEFRPLLDAGHERFGCRLEGVRADLERAIDALGQAILIVDLLEACRNGGGGLDRGLGLLEQLPGCRKRPLLRNRHEIRDDLAQVIFVRFPVTRCSNSRRA